MNLLLLKVILNSGFISGFNSIISAFDLAFLAYQDYFREGFRVMEHSAAARAIATNWSKSFSDRSYLNNIEANLRALDPRR